jgi:hypothetical protein
MQVSWCGLLLSQATNLQAAITLLLAERSAECLLLSVMSNDPLHNDDVSVGASLQVMWRSSD